MVLLFFYFVPQGPHWGGPRTTGWFGGFGNWDGGWYLGRAAGGYPTMQSTAFFPFFPLIVKIFQRILGFDYLTMGFLVSNISLLLAMIILYRVTENISDKVTARRTLFLLIAFPTALFFNVTYTESLTLLTTALFFYFLQQDRWYPAMISGFVATGVHDLGVVLAFPALIYWWKNRERFSNRENVVRFFSISLIGLSLIGYMVFLFFKFGNPIAFVEAQKYWDRVPVIPIVSVFSNLFNLFSASHDWNYVLIMVVNGGCTLLFVVAGIWMLMDRERFLSGDLMIFFWLTLLLSIVSGTGGNLQSYGRFMVVIFPGFMILGRKIRNEYLFWSLVTVFFILKMILLGMFTNAYWVT